MKSRRQFQKELTVKRKTLSFYSQFARYADRYGILPSEPAPVFIIPE
jgi:hypothetical protein